MVGRALQIRGSLGQNFGNHASASGRLLVGSAVVMAFGVSVAGPQFSVQIIVPAGVGPGQAFTVRIDAHAEFGTFLTVDGSGSVNVVLENVRPALSIDPFQTPKVQTELPYAAALTGTASEGSGPPYAISAVEFQTGGAPFAPAQQAVPGSWARWRVPLSLPAGDTVVTLRAHDPFGIVTTLQATLTVDHYAPPPAPGPKRTLSGLPTSSSVTSWSRLEPQCGGADFAQTTQARLFDPLWMLSRQWQMGEFQGEDAGTPARTRVRATSATLTRCHIGVLPPNTATQAPAYDASRMPLETLVERRRMQAANANEARMLPLAVEGGLHFLRTLEASTAGAKYRKAFLALYVLQPPDPAPDAATQRFVAQMAGRAPDARRLAAALAGGAPFDPALKVANPDKAALRALADAWLAWWSALATEPAGPADDAWEPARLEYAVSVSARLSDDPFDECTYSADEFDGGRLDWSSFDANAEVNMGTAGDRSAVAVNEATVPAPITFRGAPAPRFWEMEDAKIAYGLIAAGPTDLAHLMVIEYASSYGNDWYSVPLTLPLGSVTCIDSLIVTDTFGVKHLLRPIGDPALPAAHFSMWQNAPIRRAGGDFVRPVANRFFLPPTIASASSGAVLEDVLFMRDEMANMAWAIERSTESALEEATPRYEGDPAPAAAAPTAGGLPRYVLASRVAANWIPLLPVQQRQGTALVSRLVRGAVLEPDGSRGVRHAKGDVLNAAQRLLLFDEEVPREGVRVTRQRRLARWTDGSSWLWTTFRAEVGRGEGSSGLVFDRLESSDEPG